MDITPLVQRINDHITKVQTLSAQYLTPLNNAYNEAHSDFLNMHAKMMRLYSPRDYANNMHVHLRDQIKKHFANVPEAYFDEKPGRSFKLLIDGQKKGIGVFLAFLLKKQGRGYRTANIQTDTVKALISKLLII